MERLKARFCGEERVHIITAEKNLGFAQGNNRGIAYAREHFSPDFLVAANSDIIFEQPDYCQKLFEIIAGNRLRFWEAILFEPAVPSILIRWQGSVSTQSLI